MNMLSFIVFSFFIVSSISACVLPGDSLTCIIPDSSKHLTETFNVYNVHDDFFRDDPNDSFEELSKLFSHPLFKKDREILPPYSKGAFTKISPEQILLSKNLTANPPWSEGDLEKVHKIYSLHEETQLDRNLLSLITHFTKVIIHGDINQQQLETQLNHFDIRKLLSEGPYPNPVLSNSAQKLILESLIGFDQIIDVHLHNLGYDEGNYLNPKISTQKLTSSKNYFAFLILRYASGMSSVAGSTHEARKRIHLYTGHFPKLCGFILPIHKAIWDNQSVDWTATGSFLKNRSALLTATTFDNPYSDSKLYPAVSVHPFDPKWKEKLWQAYLKGIHLVKWMPPQSIPPDSDLLDDYYKTMQQLGLTLIAHAGPEHAIPTDDHNKQWSDWGNPLRFRKPLSLGVNVILAHSGHKDIIPDVDDPKQSKIQGYKLFIRLARETHQKNQQGDWGKLYGDLAAVTTHYGPDFIKELLLVAHEDGIRLIYGSDYPYTNLIRPQNDAYELCADYGLLDIYKVEPLKEIRSWNPLLGNYVFTKNLIWRTADGKNIQFPDSTFTGQFKGAPLKLFDKSKWDAFNLWANF